MKTAAYTVAAVLALAVAAVQPAAAAVLDCPKAGTVIKTSNGSTLTFAPAEGPVCIYSNGGKTRKLINGIWKADAVDAGSALAAFQSLDLTPGQEVSFMEDGTWNNTFTVLRTERITVPAGTFDTVVIGWNRRSGGYEHNALIWFAPKVGYRIKFGVEVVRGMATAMQNWEAEQVSLP